jgi:hypothetical protein
MGTRTDTEIMAFQAETGITPASNREALEALSQAAFHLIRIIELEKSGIRQGDGYWHGGCEMTESIGDVMALCQRVLEHLRGKPIDRCTHTASRKEEAT